MDKAKEAKYNYEIQFRYKIQNAMRSMMRIHDDVVGVYKQTSPPADNGSQQVTIALKSGAENTFTWKYKNGTKWDLILYEGENESPNCLKTRSWPTLPCNESGAVSVQKFKVGGRP